MEQQQTQSSKAETAEATAAVSDEEDPSRLADEVESRLRDHLAKTGQEYPPGCQADWLAGVVANRILKPDDEAPEDADSSRRPTLDSLVKLCVYLMENLTDMANAYEEIYAEQLAGQRDECASAHAQVAALEDENGRLREQLHRRAEELRDSAAAVEAMKARSLRAAAGRHQFDEAVAVEDDDEDDEEVEEEEGVVAEEKVKVNGGGCHGCARLHETVNRLEAEATVLAEAAAQNAALKADLDDWEADMAEKVLQNVELSAQLETCQRQLRRLGGGATAAATAATAADTKKGIFGRWAPLLPRRK